MDSYRNKNQKQHPKTNPKPKTKNKSKARIILITLGTICGVIAAGFLVWIAFAAIVSNMDECMPLNDYCWGVWPFQKEHSHYDGGGSDCVKHNPESTCLPWVDKPIIYLYPEATTEISVTLGHPDKLTATYPEYNNGWQVIAEPNGNLTQTLTGRQLYGLYWEGDNGDFQVTNEGFIVKDSEAATFLEDKLSQLGLSAHEAEEFIIYWLPILQQNPYNYVRFATPAEIENYMPLTITPKPDTTIRVLMITKPLDHSITIREQILPDTPKRRGFTVVEWGGTKQN